MPGLSSVLCMLAKPLENMTRLLKYAKIAHGTNMGTWQLGLSNNATTMRGHKMFVALSLSAAAAATKKLNNMKT